jgi:hypothetical protein
MIVGSTPLPSITIRCEACPYASRLRKVCACRAAACVVRRIHTVSHSIRKVEECTRLNGQKITLQCGCGLRGANRMCIRSPTRAHGGHPLLFSLLGVNVLAITFPIIESSLISHSAEIGTMQPSKVIAQVLERARTTWRTIRHSSAKPTGRSTLLTCSARKAFDMTHNVKSI